MTLMLPPISEMRLEIIPPGGPQIRLDRWEAYSLTLTCRGVSTFDVQLPPTEENRGLLAHHAGQRFRIFYKDSLQFTGLVDERSDDTRVDSGGGGGTDLRMAGRDFAGLLSDCTIAAKSLRIGGKTLLDIAKEWIEPWSPELIPDVGGNVAASRYIAAGGGGSGTVRRSDWERLGTDPKGYFREFLSSVFGGKKKLGKFGKNSPYYAGVGTEQIKTSKVRLGWTVWKGLADLCAQIGVSPMMACDGGLLLYKPCYGFDSSVYGEGLVVRWDDDLRKAKAGSTVEAVRLETRISNRRSVWHVAGVGKPSKGARGAETILGNSQIKDVGPAFWERATATTLGSELLHKPGVMKFKKLSNRKHLVRAARRAVTESILAGLSYEFMVPGHHAPTGVLWMPDTTVRVHDERNDVKKLMYIHSVERRFDMNAGRVSKISVFPPDMWLGDLDDPSISDNEWYRGMMAHVWW